MNKLRDELLSKGFPPGAGIESRVQVVTEVLLRNGIRCVADLDGIGEQNCFDHFSCLDISLLTSAESAFISRLADEASEAGKRRREGMPTLGVKSGDAPSGIVDKAIGIVRANTGAAWDTTGNGPRQAIRGLKRALDDGLDKQDWLEKARLSAILGCKKLIPY